MIRILIITFLSCLSLGLQAQQKTLMECVQIAWENNINVQQTELLKSNSRIDLDQAKANRYPNLNAGSSLNLSGRSVDPTNNQFATSSFFTNNFNLSSNVLLYNGGQVRKNIERAKMSQQSADLQIEDIKQTIALQVSNAYLSILFAQENLGIAENRKKVTDQQIDQLEKLIEAGLRPRNSILDLEATAATNEQNIISAQGNLEIANLNLNQLMLIPINEKFDLVIPQILLSELEDPFTMDSESIYKESVQNQPSIKNTDLNIKLAELDKAIAGTGLLPTIAVGGSLGTNYSSLGRVQDGTNEIIVNQDIIFQGTETTIGFKQNIPNFVDQNYFSQVSDNVTYGYGLSLSVPIYNNYRNKANINRAEINKRSAELNHSQNLNQFRTQIEQALLDARNARKQYDANEKSVIATKRALDNTQVSFEQGNANSFELSIASDNYDTAQIQSLISKYDYIFKMKIIDFYLGKSINF